MSYSKLGRRRSSGGLQWMLIGFFPGLLCGGILIFGLFLSGILEGFNLGQAATVEVTQLVPQVVNIVVTATPDPNQPTAEPQVVVVTATPNLEAPIVNLAPPTATPTSLALPTATSQIAGATSPQSVEGTLSSSTNPLPTVATAAPITTGSIPAALQGILTRLQPIPGGTFTMGTTVDEILNAVNQCVQRDQGACDVSFGEDSTPPIQVQLDSFQMEESEVTFAQYVAFLNYLRSQGRSHRDGCLGFLCIQTVNESQDALITFDSANYNVVTASANFPVYAVTWYGAQAYCQAIGRRLPTEAEWEYAARGGSSDTLYPWGNEWSEINARVRIKTDTVFGPVAVKQYSPYNGLYDMAGNMAEWVADWYDESYYQQMANQAQPVFNPQGPPTALQKVLRGGSWDALPFFARAVHRQSEFPAPDNLSDSFPRSIGFRCAADIAEGAALPASSAVTNPTTLLTITVAPGAIAPPEAATQTTSGTNRG